MTLEPPKVLRIKRKRNQDPLQALILQDIHAAKRSKPSTPIHTPSPSPTSTPKPIQQNAPNQSQSVYFTLARTDDVVNEKAVLDSILLDSSPATNSRKRKFVIPNQPKEEPVLEELTDLVQRFLSGDDASTKDASTARKKRSKPNSAVTPQQPDDFVYDVYHVSPIPLTSHNHPQSQIGYIRFFSDNNDLYQSDDDDIAKAPVISDDEDSNAEDFYQNDYPSDEDAGSNSDIDSNRSVNDTGDITNLMNDLALKEDDLDELQHIDFEDYEDQYEDVDFLKDDVYYNDSDSSFKRNTFFASDEHDELAIHRDKIFGRLEKMIQEQDEV